MKLNAITATITLAAAGTIFAAIAYNGSHMAHASETVQPKGESNETVEVVKTPEMDSASISLQQASLQQASLQQVSFQQVAVQNTNGGSYQATVKGYGEAKARFELDYGSEVSGRVTSLSAAFETGNVIKKGDVLATLDDTSYQQALSQAKADVATAKLELLEEQREGVQARSEWERSGLSGEPDSPLVLREPQLANAKANLANAQQALVKAQKDVSDTKILAPFDALVISRDIQPGSYVQAGESIATLYSVDRVEVSVPLSEAQWSKLPQWEIDNDENQNNWVVSLSNNSGTAHWQARVERVEQHITQEARQRSIVVVVDLPLEQDTPLFPGNYVQASLSGAQFDNLWELPSSSISQQGDIWFVDAAGELQKSNAQKLFENKNNVYVQPISGMDSAQIVKRPLSNFQVGMKVTPNEEG